MFFEREVEKLAARVFVCFQFKKFKEKFFFALFHLIFSCSTILLRNINSLLAVKSWFDVSFLRPWFFRFIYKEQGLYKITKTTK